MVLEWDTAVEVPEPQLFGTFMTDGTTTQMTDLLVPWLADAEQADLFEDGRSFRWVEIGEYSEGFAVDVGVFFAQDALGSTDLDGAGIQQPMVTARWSREWDGEDAQQRTPMRVCPDCAEVPVQETTELTGNWSFGGDCVEVAGVWVETPPTSWTWSF